MAGSLRSHMQAGAQNSSNSDSSSHDMMSHIGQSGGRRSKGRKHRRRRSKKAGKRCKSGGSNCGTNKKTGGSSVGKSRAVKGGMMASGLGAVIKEALVPFGLFAIQKQTQRKKYSGEKFGKSRRRR